MTRAAPHDPWMRLWFDTWALGVEASSVIGLRTLKLAAGGQLAEQEAVRMVGEKVTAAIALYGMAATGVLGASPAAVTGRGLAHVRRKVRANRRRLTK